jgi:hypothetical protein
LTDARTHLAVRNAGLARLAQQPAQRDADFFHQRQAEIVRAAEVPVKAVGHHAGLARNLANPQAGEAAALAHQRQRGLDQAGAGEVLALGARQGVLAPGGCHDWPTL